MRGECDSNGSTVCEDGGRDCGPTELSVVVVAISNLHVISITRK